MAEAGRSWPFAPFETLAGGCYRLPQDGRRFRAGEWPAGDEDLALQPGSPCQGDTFEG